MKSTLTFLSTLVLFVSMSPAANASQYICETSALQLAKAIRMGEMPADIQGARFSVVTREQDENSETFVIEMLVSRNGTLEKIMTDQRLVMATGDVCILASYDMPGAG